MKEKKIGNQYKEGNEQGRKSLVIRKWGNKRKRGGSDLFFFLKTQVGGNIILGHLIPAVSELERKRRR